MRNKIVIMGVGTAGNNIINRIISNGFEKADFWAVNTDVKALEISKAPNKLRIGIETAGDLGCGSDPKKGAESANESKVAIKKAFENAKIIFIIAGFGGGTGTGATPIIAKIAKETKVPVIPIVTIPFSFEGKKRQDIALNGIEKLKEQIQDIIVIKDELILKKLDKKMTISAVFSIIDEKISDAVNTMAKMIKTKTDKATALKKSKMLLTDILSAEGSIQNQNEDIPADAFEKLKAILDDDIDGYINELEQILEEKHKNKTCSHRLPLLLALLYKEKERIEKENS